MNSSCRCCSTFLASIGVGTLYLVLVFMTILKTGCVMCLVAQSYLALLQPHGLWPPGSSVPRIFQGRILEWVTIFSSRGSSWPRDWTWVSCASCIAGRFLTYWAIREALKTDWQETNQGLLVEFYFVTKIPHYRISMEICPVKKSCQNFRFLIYNRKVK